MGPKLHKWICFYRDLTLPTRFIAFLGIAISVLLLTVLLNDLSSKNFEMSRNIVLALGLDWRHIHPKGNTSAGSDPEGKTVCALMIFYAIVFFLTNTLLYSGTIWEKPLLAVPWLTCEFLGCLSKLGALIFHVVTEANSLSPLFLIGSTIYIALMFWWWLVVFCAQKTWRKKQEMLERSVINATASDLNSILMNSPEPYRSNRFYVTI